jgi:hypothetical protein
VHEADGKFVAWVFIPESYYATDVLFCEYGDTAVEAAQKIKDWWLDDMTATGALGDRRYQPHYNTCTLKYRFLPAWKMRT